jgi:hypothetical protein
MVECIRKSVMMVFVINVLQSAASAIPVTSSSAEYVMEKYCHDLRVCILLGVQYSHPHFKTYLDTARPKLIPVTGKEGRFH